MARASIVFWTGLAMGAALVGGARANGVTRTAGACNVLGQTATEPAGARAALTSGRDSYRHGDFEMAAIYFQQAQAGLGALSPAEQQELVRWIQLDDQALQGRREGAVQVRQAAAALRAGRTQAAEALLRALGANQFLSPADQAKVQELTRSLSGAAVAPAVRGNGAASARADVTEAARTRPPASASYPGSKTVPERSAAASAPAPSPYAPLPVNDSSWKTVVTPTAEASPRTDAPGSNPPAPMPTIIQGVPMTEANGEILVRPGSPEGPKQVVAADGRSLLKTGRQLLEMKKYDDAEKVALHVKQTWSGSEGLFDDSPDRLLADIRAAQAAAAFRQAVAVVAEGRRLLQAGRLEEARIKAQTAERLGGLAGAWPRGDNPALLLADIDAAQAERAAAAAAVSASKQKAQQALAEARQLAAAGRLLEARQKAQAAKTWGATFEATEVSPDQVIMQIAGQANHRVQVLLGQADDCIVVAKSEPAQLENVERALVEARQLATAFGLDCHPIDTRVAQARKVRDEGPAASAAQAPAGEAARGNPIILAQAQVPATPVSPAQEGQEILEKARMELKNGEFESARRLAEKAFNGSYGVQADAEALLRSVGAEEYSDRCRATNRSFDTALGLYHRKDYTQAAAMFRSMDPTLLKPEKQAKLRELMRSPELQPRELVRVANEVPAAGPGKAKATDGPPAGAETPAVQDYAKEVEKRQAVQVQALRQRGMDAMQQATKHAQAGEYDQALDVLQDFVQKLRDAQLEPERMAQLKRPVDARMQQIKTVKASRDLERMKSADQNKIAEARLAKVRAEELKQKQVSDLMRQYHEFYSQAKYADAEVAAQKAHDLDPENPQVNAALGVAQMRRNVENAKEIKLAKEELFLSSLNAVEKEGKPVEIDDPIKFDPELWKKIKGRKSSTELEAWNKKSDKEREIERRLLLPTSLDFKNLPLEQVLQDLSATNQINIVPDRAALEEANVSLERPLTLHLESVPLKSALNLLLGQAHLTYVIEDSVLKVTTLAHAQGKLIRKVYPIGELIVPVPNHSETENPIIKALQESGSYRQTPMAGVEGYPWRSMVAGGTTIGSQGTGVPESPGMPAKVTPAGTRPSEQTLQELLMDLITNTIKPESWSKVGGPGTIEYFPLGMALVVTQTPDIQEQIQDLLQALRRLQDIEVAVEVRFITLNEAFYERIGVDFRLNLPTHNTAYEPQLVTGQFAPPGYINAFRPANFVTGLNAPQTFTSDLAIPIRSTSFSPAIPPFGGFPNAFNADGGISMGLAFLSDIQVFLFMEAAQADRRTNVMQAPKLTLFNGQTSTININETQFFVTNIQVIGFGGQLIFNPFNTAVNTGTNLTIQAVVSGDRRFVRLSLAPNLTNISSPVAALFPITAFITPVFEGGAPGPPVPFTQFLQQPAFTTVAVNTTVSVPDGGTVLLGGLKTLREGRNEFGPPILSKLPYINRLFKNVGYGKEAESLLIMVTPRVIINEEEEAIQTGVGALAPGAGQ